MEIASVQNILAALIGAAVAWKYNEAKVKHDNEIFRRELFLKYNELYRPLNQRLEALVMWERETEKSVTFENPHGVEIFWNNFKTDPNSKIEHFDTVFDYLNLCSEEYYWFRKHFVDLDVWDCWKNGMLIWHKKSFVFKKIVESEILNNAHYYNKDFLKLFASE